MLLYGASGAGKTLLAGLVSKEIGLPFIHLSLADLIPGDLQIALDLAGEGAVLFLDELQAATRRLRDALLVALDPAREHPFLAIGATTDPGALTAPLRRRFRLEIPLEEYSVSEAEALTLARAEGMGLKIDGDLPYVVARAARANPARVARLLTEGSLLVEGTTETLTSTRLATYLDRTNRDERGVDGVELEMLLFLRDQCDGPAGMSKFVDVLGLDLKLVRERLHMLRREGLVQNRGSQGHALSRSGRDYLRQRGL
jgi:Holliday junction DNA helicase RuvB